MPEVLDNPVIKDAEMDSLREAALAVDNGETAEVPSVQEGEQHATPEPEKTEGTVEQGKPDNSETIPEKPSESKLQTKPEDRPRDEHGRFLPKEGDKVEGVATTQAPKVETPTKPETPYEQAKREGREREARAWQKIEQEKAEIAKQRAELQQRMTQRSEPARDESQYTAEDYDKAAEEFLAAGDSELAQKAKDAAKAIRVVEQQTAYQREVHKFQEEYAADANKAIEQEPDAIKKDTPLFNALANVFQEEPLLWRVPQGYSKALKIAKLSLDAGMVSELKEKNKQLQAEVDRLNGITRIDGSGPTSPSSPKKFDDMNLEEQMAHARAAAERLDAA